MIKLLQILKINETSIKIWKKFKIRPRLGKKKYKKKKKMKLELRQKIPNRKGK